MDRSWRGLRKIDNRQELLSEASENRENAVCMALIEKCQELADHYVLPLNTTSSYTAWGKKWRAQQACKLQLATMATLQRAGNTNTEVLHLRGPVAPRIQTRSVYNKH